MRDVFSKRLCSSLKSRAAIFHSPEFEPSDYNGTSQGEKTLSTEQGLWLMAKNNVGQVMGILKITLKYSPPTYSSPSIKSPICTPIL